MLLDDTPLAKTVVLVDTNAIIEAVRTATWNALTGAVLAETVEECCDEASRGDATHPTYVAVSSADLERLHCVHVVTAHERAEYLLADPEAVGMDAGERDLFAHAYRRANQGDDVWVLCSSDKAAIRAAVRIKISDQLRSLEAICRAVGARPKSNLKSAHLESFLKNYRTMYLLGGWMGACSEYCCPKCGYSASRMIDGYSFGENTRRQGFTCLDCRELFSARLATGEQLAAAGGDVIAKPTREELSRVSCPKNPSHHVRPWESEDGCPQ